MKELIPVLIAVAFLPPWAAALVPLEVPHHPGEAAEPPLEVPGGCGGSEEVKDESHGLILSGSEAGAEVLVSSSDASGTVVEFLLRGLSVEERAVGNEAFSVLSIPEGATTTEIGRPELPVMRAMIAVPGGAAVRATILEASCSTYPGFRVLPFQPPEVDGLSGDRGLLIDDELYSQDGFYPEGLVEVGPPGIWRDLVVVELQANPVAFNPATGELRVYDRILVRIDYEGGTLEAETAEPKFARMYRDVISNYDLLAVEVRDPEPSGGEVDLPADVGIDGPESPEMVKYLSIRHAGQTSYEAISPLLEWREARGVPVLSCYFPPSSTPSAEEVKEVVASVYAAHPELEYLLIVGDIGRLPWRPNWDPSASFSSYFPGMTIPSDYWYACVAGSDLYPEVAVGRISANSDSEVSQQVAKILAYEMGAGAEGWTSKVLLVAHAQEAPVKYQGCKEAIRTAPYERPFSFATAYGAPPSSGGDGATNADVLAAAASGIGIVNYRGHGSYTSWGPDWNSAGEEFETDDAHAVAGVAFPAVLSIACYNAALDQSGEGLAEAFVKDDGSAVAFLGAARPSWTEPNHDFDRYLFDAMGNEGISDLGWVVNDAQVEVMAKYGSSSYATDNLKMYLLLGDPALQVGPRPPNGPPGTPERPAGPTSVRAGTTYSYSTSSSDADGDRVKYTFNWGDGTLSETEFLDSGAAASLPHRWEAAGTRAVRVKAEDLGAASGWSDPLEVTIFPGTRRGSGTRRSPDV